eukprot:TRINITY_DN32079_c0_g1_i1.p1 TRINITY_DN32079_c0_g1~~TRINITY_DN32079_c0_g1_i1.p1  ORF type:complete len:403 (-),score=52.48 TRINITY_DN32079_c0_g1_i1:177-1385(-)
MDAGRSISRIMDNSAYYTRCCSPSKSLVWSTSRLRRTSKRCSSQRERNVFSYLDPSRSIYFGAGLRREQFPQFQTSRPKLCFLESKVDPELVHYLLDEPGGPFGACLEAYNGVSSVSALEPGLQKWGFSSSPKEPFLLKADWHSFPSSKSSAMEVFVPRLDHSTMVHSAPERIAVFAEAVRRVNSGCWERLKSELKKLHTVQTDEETRWLLCFLLKCLDAGGLFGSIEAQVGLDTDWNIMRSHKDGATGLLHLGITLLGQRTLVVGLHDSSEMADSCQIEPSVWDEESWQRMEGAELLQIPMMKGSAYLSSPFLFEHGVVYHPGKCASSCSPATAKQGSEMTVALMYRIAFPPSSDAHGVNQYRGPGVALIADTVAHTLQQALEEGSLRLPTTAELECMQCQ